MESHGTPGGVTCGGLPELSFLFFIPCSSFTPKCRTHHTGSLLTLSSFQSFQGSQGRAYLFNSVVNVGCGPAEERVLLTGLHAVADIYCENCKTTLGWKYEHAFESSQKYKEGKFIIELAHMIKDNGWE
uniref:Protein yippee-like n=1 Tax=Castor canadensis TaxID=51338 RepID=A0A8B7UEG5_CASCN|nr:protein yippee-like 1 isoform X1 [Castor canadensis]